MRIALIGRTTMLLKAGRLLVERGHEIPVVWTSSAEEFYGIDVEDFRRFARDIGADFQCGATLNRAAAEVLPRYGCDIAVSVNWPGLIDKPVLDQFAHGILNAHAGDLPRYRGNACPNWAILAGEEKIGLCIHQMAPELDAGPIVCRDYMNVTDQTYIGDVYAWLEGHVPGLFVDAVDGLASGAVTPQPQPDDPALQLRCYPRRPEDARIDWRQNVMQVLRLIRASSYPLDGAYTSFEGAQRVTVWRAEPAEHPGSFFAVPGQVCFRIGNDPVIACADGLLRLIDISLDGSNDLEDAKRVVHRSLRNRLV